MLQKALLKTNRSAMMATRKLNKAWGTNPRNYEASYVSDQQRFEDEPEPTEDMQISK